MGKGSKTCQFCSFITGPRSKNCPSCGKGFKLKDKVQPDLIPASGGSPGASTALSVAHSRKELGHKEVDFRELKKNDYFKVLGGGPVWPKAIEDGGDLACGYYGIFKVRYIDEEGIHAYGVKSADTGHSYIYMGPEKKMKSGTLMRPHKIVRVTRKVKDND
jgi:hypothetical protein